MTPERANEILQECRRKPLVGSLSLLNCAEVDAILAACREERHAAYDDIASVVQPYIILGQGKDGSEIAAALHSAILESRGEP